MKIVKKVKLVPSKPPPRDKQPHPLSPINSLAIPSSVALVTRWTVERPIRIKGVRIAIRPPQHQLRARCKRQNYEPQSRTMQPLTRTNHRSCSQPRLNQVEGACTREVTLWVMTTRHRIQRLQQLHCSIDSILKSSLMPIVSAHF